MMKSTQKFITVLKSKLAKKFSLYITSIGIIMALIISAASVYINYKIEILNLKKELIYLEKSLKNSLILNMWELNTPALNIMINDLIRNKNIVYAKLTDDEGNVLVKKGIKPKKYLIKRKISFYYTYNNKKTYLGKLIYFATTKYIYEKNKKFIIYVALLIFGFFALLSFIIIFIYWNTTVKYILMIKNHTDKLKINGYKKRKMNLLSLHKKNNQKDEIDDLVDSINDMYKEIIKKYSAIEYQSLHDFLTDLPNRRMMDNILKEKIKKCKNNNCYGALFYVDLDDFKLINESMGHTIGDIILKEISNRLKTINNNEFIPARLSGDEFLILQTKLYKNKKETEEKAKKFANKIISVISKPIKINNRYFKISTSIGISILSPESSSETIIKQADNALYHAKRKGRSQIEIFKPQMQKIRDRQLEIEQLLNKAIENNLIFMNYQPKFDINGKIKSAESLVRMRDENGNIISPAEFIPIVEETGLIIEIGDEIIKQVYNFINKNQQIIKNSNIKSIAINISPTQYNSPSFVSKILSFTKQYNIDPKLIIFEITEEVVANNIENVIEVMQSLTKFGFSFSIDDFGTGYSSMKYLKNLPLKELKIDKSFIDEITTDEKARAIVKTIIDMAHNLTLHVVAEGVETKEQLEILKKYNCDLYQGYLFSKPLLQEDFLKIIKNH